MFNPPQNSVLVCDLLLFLPFYPVLIFMRIIIKLTNLTTANAQYNPSSEAIYRFRDVIFPLCEFMRIQSAIRELRTYLVIMLVISQYSQIWILPSHGSWLPLSSVLWCFPRFCVEKLYLRLWSQKWRSFWIYQESLFMSSSQLQWRIWMHQWKLLQSSNLW